MEERLAKWNTMILLPGAVVALVAGLISIYKDTAWYIYVPLFATTAVLIILSFFVRKEIHEFETLSQSMTIDIIDEEGKIALFTNNKTLKAKKNGAHNFDYILYCDGKIEEIMTKQGAITEIKSEGGRFIVKTNTESPIKKGEIVEHTLTAKYVDGFSSEKEYWQTTKNAPGSNIKISIITPLTKPIKEFKAFKIIGHTKILLEQQPKRIMIGNKHGIELDFQQAKFLEKYRLEWTW